MRVAGASGRGWSRPSSRTPTSRACDASHSLRVTLVPYTSATVSARIPPPRSTWSFVGGGDSLQSVALRPEETMTAKLDKTIKRELEIDGKAYTIAISPEGIKVTEKGRRNGPEVSWRSIVSGDATLNENLKISVDASSDQ